MEDKTFDLKTEYDIVIYGAGETGKNVAKNLTLNGFRIIAILDQNVNEILDMKSIPVIKPDEFIPKKPSNTVLIITLNNGAVHEKIAEKLYSRVEIEKIIFLPMTITMSDEKKRLLRRAYTNIMYGVTDIKSIPIFENEEKKYRLIDDTGVVGVSLWYPIEKLYTIADIKNRDVSYWNQNSGLFLDKPVMELQAYRDLFLYLQNGVGDISEYLKEQGCLAGRNKEEVIQDRKLLYALYKKELEYGNNFFTESPCKVVWDDKNKKLCIEDGLHRMYFLISQGFKEVPVFMSTDDYEKMCIFEYHY